MGFRPVLLEDVFWKPHYILSHHPVAFPTLRQVPAVLLIVSIIMHSSPVVSFEKL